MWISLRGIVRRPEFRPLMIVVILSIIMIVLPLPIKTTLSRIGSVSVLYPFIMVDRFLLKIDTTFEMNRHLNRRLNHLSMVTSTLIESRYENARLREMLGFNINLPYELVPAEVLAISPASQFKSVLINAGTKAGVMANMPVISPSGIVGKTVSADGNSAVVQLLFDPNCKIAARVQSYRTQGIVDYKGGQYLSLSKVPMDQEVSVGDSVVSSGLGGIFPKGLFIGRIVKVGERKGEMFREIFIEPGANFSILEEVFVITSSSGQN